MKGFHHRWLRAHGWIGLAAGLLASAAVRADFQGSTHLMPYDEDTLGYGKTADTSAIARLQERIDRGEVTLRKDHRFGYLLSILEELKVPAASQMLVFSKTSFQRERIGPANPRALYYNEGVYVGYVPGSHILEFTGVDPKLGAVFYTLDQEETGKPKFVRTDNCTECHASARTMGVPGHLVRSFQTDDSGMVDLLTGVDPVNHRTPLADRWGGWYVTGRHGSQTHRGNLVGKAAFTKQAKEPNHLGNLTELSRFFDPAKYPAPTSDIVSLMVLEHQQHGHNFITRVGYEARVHLSAYGHVNYLRNAVDSIVKYLLFVDEVPLSDSIQGNPEFALQFEKQGRRDSKGRSLRQLDLKTRMFRYPCSFLIQGEAFAGLPEPLRQRIYQRLHDVLTGKDTAETWKRLTPEIRAEILEILRETQPDLPPTWKS
jgi:hypothetical protein